MMLDARLVFPQPPLGRSLAKVRTGKSVQYDSSCIPPCLFGCPRLAYRNVAAHATEDRDGGKPRENHGG